MPHINHLGRKQELLIAKDSLQKKQIEFNQDAQKRKESVQQKTSELKKRLEGQDVKFEGFA